jgi:uncharacterized protein YidB (DUF937 family)
MAQRGMPSLLALLGLLAVAGYQNRDKLGEILQGNKTGDPADPQNGSGGGLLGELGKMFGGGAAGGSLSKGLDDLLGTLRNAGHAETADSWVNPEAPSKELAPKDLEAAVGKDTLQELATRTGLGYDELLKRLSTSIPDAVDRMTPSGKLPQNDDEARQWLAGSPA